MSAHRDPLFTPRFAALWFFQFATFFAAFQLFPAMPFHILELGGSKSAAGMFLFFYTMASALSAPIMGTVADRFGRKRVLITASMLFVVFSLFYAFVRWLPLVWIISVAHGAAWSGILSSAGAIMTDYIPPSRRTEGLAYWGMAPTVAVAIAPPVGLFVYKFGWLALCLDLAAISVMTSLWAMRLPSVDRHAETTPLRLNELWDWDVAKATLSLAVTAVGYGGITTYVAILSRERHLQPDSLYFTVSAAATIFIRVFTSHLGDRFGPRVLLYPAFVAMPISLALLAFAYTHVQLIVSAILFGLGLGAAFPAFMTLIVGATDQRRRARTFGSVIWAFDTGIGLGSLVIGIIGQRHGLGSAFAMSAVLSALAIPIFLLTTRRFFPSSL